LRCVREGNRHRRDEIRRHRPEQAKHQRINNREEYDAHGDLPLRHPAEQKQKWQNEDQDIRRHAKHQLGHKHR